MNGSLTKAAARAQADMWHEANARADAAEAALAESRELLLRCSHSLGPAYVNLHAAIAKATRTSPPPPAHAELSPGNSSDLRGEES